MAERNQASDVAPAYPTSTGSPLAKHSSDTLGVYRPLSAQGVPIGTWEQATFQKFSISAYAPAAPPLSSPPNRGGGDRG